MTALSKEQLAVLIECAEHEAKYLRSMAKSWPKHKAKAAQRIASAKLLEMAVAGLRSHAPAVAWVEWKPGDDLPPGGILEPLYHVAMRGVGDDKTIYYRHHGAQDHWMYRHVIAYMPIAPPPPYAAPAREKV